MKRLFLLFLFIIMLIIHNYGQARIDCRDNSWHLQKKYDYKEDHAVECLCPCPEKMGRCLKCQHYHPAKPWIIIKNNGKKTTARNALFSQTMQKAVQHLLAKYRQNRIFPKM